MNQDINKDNIIESEIQQEFSAFHDSAGYCPVCKRMERQLFQYYTKWPSGFINDKDIIEKYASVHGFCPPHSWQLESFSSKLTTAHGYPALLEKIAAMLDHPAPGKSCNFDLLKKGPGECLVCSFLQDKEKENIKDFIRFLSYENSRNAYSETMGLCIRHLHLVIQDIHDEEITGFLFAHASRRLQELAQNLNVYKTKMKELKRGQLSKDEEMAAHRSIAYIFGLRSLSPYFLSITKEKYD